MSVRHRPQSLPSQKQLKTSPVHRMSPIHATDMWLSCAGNLSGKP